jgi:hypothetical protein
MFCPIELGIEFFAGLTAIDEAIVQSAAAEPCRDCGGPLYRGDYPRKPRSGLVGQLTEAFDRRFSLCCGREGCRRRATPPSVRFLGRRVYVGAVVILASVVALAASVVREAERRTGVPARTTRRWLRWWRGPFTATGPFCELSARLLPAVSRSALPTAILERLDGDPVTCISKFLGWLAPLTTGSSPDGARFLRGIV